MASTALNFMNQYTNDNGAIKDLRELIDLKTLKVGALADTLNVHYGVVSGKKIGGIGEFGDLGESLSYCNPSYNNTSIKTQEKVWELGKFSIAEELCADDFEQTIVRHCMNTGTRRADLTDTDLFAIIEPKLQLGIEKGLWRYLWFGDKDAKNVTDGGVITDGKALKHFTAIDGFFKRLFALAPSGSDQRVEIAANAETTWKDQRDKLLDPGVATGIFDNLINHADVKIIQQNDSVIFCTWSMATALANDIKKNNKGSELQWESLFDKMMYVSQYNTQTIVALPIWDEMIRAYENQGAYLNKPHRAVFTYKENLFAGVESTGSFLPDLDIWFSKDSQTNKILGHEKVGTQIWEDNLFQIAY